MQKEQIDSIKLYAQKAFKNRDASHDYPHSQRVAHLGVYLSKFYPKADALLIEAVAYLHDVIDHKYLKEEDKENLLKFLKNLDINPLDIDRILYLAEHISFSKGFRDDKDIELKIIQDADRLDAIGSLGIARTLIYGATFNRPLYDPAIPLTAGGDASTMHHFYEKLFKLKDQMHTKEAFQMALEREKIMVDFIENFEKEWNFKG